MVDAKYIEFAHTLADAAAGITRKFFRTPMEINSKEDASPVTIADCEAERLMRQMIHAAFPDHGVMGEEFGDYKVQSEYVWVLDPVDGTLSFMAGLPVFGTLIALAHKHAPILGVIDQPILQERWVGDGKETELNGQPIKTRDCKEIAKATFSTTSPYLFDKEGHKHFEKIRKHARHTLYGSDCYAYAQLASGHIDLVLESGLKPHDFCALAPVVNGAGGVMTDWTGEPLSLASKGDVLACATPALHKAALELLA